MEEENKKEAELREKKRLKTEQRIMGRHIPTLQDEVKERDQVKDT